MWLYVGAPTIRSKKYNKETAQSLETPAEKRTYFRPEHVDTHPVVTFAKPYRDRRGRTRVMYAVNSLPEKQSPRSLVAWLDGQDILFVRREIQLWKDRANELAGSTGALYPDFFERHHVDYIRFAGRTAGTKTVDRYYSMLGRYVFPFFVGLMHESNVAKWVDSYPAFRGYLLTTLEPGSANVTLTALRSYLKFLVYRGEYKQLIQLKNEPVRRGGEKVLPCDVLPEWADVVTYLRSLEPGYFRWLLTVAAAFGVRVSELLCAELGGLIGKDDIEGVTKANDHLSKIIEKHKPLAMLHVTEAEKQGATNEGVSRILGTPSDEPKTGPYIAACISRELGELLLEEIEAGENVRTAEQTKLSKTTWYNFLRRLPVDTSPAKFHTWVFHDYRRYHVTMLALEWGDFWNVAHVHGHRDVATTMKYYQWGLTRRRRGEGKKFRLNLPG